MFAPIERQVKKNSNVTGVPLGKIIHEMTFDLSPYIVGGEDDDDSNSVDSTVTPKTIQDETFVSTFTLSRFCKDILVITAGSFALF